MKPIIEIKRLTKDYGEGRGVFDIDLTVNEGEMVGFVGTNGSGKTTTIRNVMGFLKPTSGGVYVNGLEAWTHSSEIVKNIGLCARRDRFSRSAHGHGVFEEPG